MNLRETLDAALRIYGDMNPYDEGDQRESAARQAVEAAGISRSNRAFAVRQVLALWAKEDVQKASAAAHHEVIAPAAEPRRDSRQARLDAARAELRAEEAARLAKRSPEEIAEQARRNAEAKAAADAAEARHAAAQKAEKEHEAAVEAVVSAIREKHPEWTVTVPDGAYAWRIAKDRNPECRVCGFLLARHVVISDHDADGDSCGYDTGEVSHSVDWRLCPELGALQTDELRKLIEKL